MKHGVVGAVNVGCLEVGDVHVHESFFPFAGKHGGDGQESEGRKGGFLEMNLRACLKLQKGSGYPGYTSRIFISDSFGDNILIDKRYSKNM